MHVDHNMHVIGWNMHVTCTVFRIGTHHNAHCWTSVDRPLVHTVQLKPMIKAQISGRTISSGISDVAIASV